MYQQLQPEPDLKDLIAYYWTGELSDAPAAGFVHREIARSSSELIFHYEGCFNEVVANGNTINSPMFGIFGQSTIPRQFVCSSNKSGIFGVKFHPTAVPLLFSLPANELTNQAFELSDLLGRKGIEIREKVSTARSFEEKILTVSQFFKSRLRHCDKHLRMQAVVHRIQERKGLVKMNELVDLACYSQRQLQRNFKEFTGFSIQTFIKLVRFEHAMLNYRHNSSTLTGLALSSGYFDQAHFNHDFKLFTGLTPSQYLSTEFS